MQRDEVVSRKDKEELIEGELYRVVDGELELVEQDPDDERMRLKISKEAGEALKRARHVATKVLGWRIDRDAVASAIIEMHSNEASVSETIRNHSELLAARRQATGR